MDFFLGCFAFFSSSLSRGKAIDRRSSFTETLVLAFRKTAEYQASAPNRRAVSTRFAAAIWWAPLLGSLLVFTAVGRHIVLDDYVLLLQARGEPALEGLPQARWDLFAFTTGDHASNQQLIEQGVMLPWWSDAKLKVAFFRPLSSLTHRLDYALFPDAPRLMYLHSIAWLFFALHLVARLYRRLEVSPAWAGFLRCFTRSILHAAQWWRGSAIATP